MSCLDENTIVALLYGRGGDDLLAAAEGHLATCDDCAHLFAAAAAATESVTASLGDAALAAREGDGSGAVTADITATEPAAPAFEAGILEAGTALNETYRLVRLIGRGAMGDVYEVTHARLSGRYAAKVLNAQIGNSPEILSRFKREAQITSGLHHPHIVQVVDFNSTSDGRPFLVMEYLEGMHLGRIIQAQAPLGLARVLQIVTPIVSALGAVHRRQIIHRDLKPQNIILVAASEEGGDEVVKLLDFGLSKRRGPQASESMLVSQQRVLVGTPLYMAPEQARGDNENVGSAADQFSLSAIIYEMLTGRPAFLDDCVQTVLYRIRYVEPEPMRTLAAGIPEGVERVVRRGLSKEPEARYPSIGAFFEALREAAQGAAAASDDVTPEPAVAGAATTSPGPAGATRAGGAPARRRRSWIAASAAAMALAIALPVIRHNLSRASRAIALGPESSRAALPATTPSLPAPSPAAVPALSGASPHDQRIRIAADIPRAVAGPPRGSPAPRRNRPKPLVAPPSLPAGEAIILPQANPTPTATATATATPTATATSAPKPLPGALPGPTTAPAPSSSSGSPVPSPAARPKIDSFDKID